MDDQATADNLENTGVKTDENYNGADATAKAVNKITGNTASKTAGNVTYSGEDTDSYDKVKELIETNDEAQ